MSQFYELQVDMMYAAWVYAQSNTDGQTSDQIYDAELRSKNSKIGPVGRKRVDAAISDLFKYGHLEKIVIEGSEKYSISRKGLEWVEDWFKITKEGKTYFFYRRREGAVIVNSTFDSYRAEEAEKAEKRSKELYASKAAHGNHFWTKWGAIFAAVSIVVSIILWKFS